MKQGIIELLINVKKNLQTIYNWIFVSDRSEDEYMKDDDDSFWW